MLTKNTLTLGLFSLFLLSACGQSKGGAAASPEGAAVAEVSIENPAPDSTETEAKTLKESAISWVSFKSTPDEDNACTQMREFIIQKKDAEAVALIDSFRSTVLKDCYIKDPLNIGLVDYARHFLPEGRTVKVLAARGVDSSAPGFTRFATFSVEDFRRVEEIFDYPGSPFLRSRHSYLKYLIEVDSKNFELFDYLVAQPYGAEFLLNFAFEKNREVIAERMLQSSVQFKCSTDREGKCPVQVAIRNHFDEQSKAIQLLVKKHRYLLNLNEVIYSKYRPIIYTVLGEAQHRHKWELADYLYAAGAPLLIGQDPYLSYAHIVSTLNEPYTRIEELEKLLTGVKQLASWGIAPRDGEAAALPTAGATLKPGTKAEKIEETALAIEKLYFERSMIEAGAIYYVRSSTRPSVAKRILSSKAVLENKNNGQWKNVQKALFFDNIRTACFLFERIPFSIKEPEYTEHKNNTNELKLAIAAIIQRQVSKGDISQLNESMQLSFEGVACGLPEALQKHLPEMLPKIDRDNYDATLLMNITKSIDHANPYPLLEVSIDAIHKNQYSFATDILRHIEKPKKRLEVDYKIIAAKTRDLQIEALRTIIVFEQNLNWAHRLDTIAEALEWNVSDKAVALMVTAVQAPNIVDANHTLGSKLLKAQERYPESASKFLELYPNRVDCREVNELIATKTWSHEFVDSQMGTPVALRCFGEVPLLMSCNARALVAFAVNRKWERRPETLEILFRPDAHLANWLTSCSQEPERKMFFETLAEQELSVFKLSHFLNSNRWFHPIPDLIRLPDTRKHFFLPLLRGGAKVGETLMSHFIQKDLLRNYSGLVETLVNSDDRFKSLENCEIGNKKSLYGVVVDEIVEEQNEAQPELEYLEKLRLLKAQIEKSYPNLGGC